MTANLTILGTAGGGPIPHRAKSGLLLNVDGRLSLIDCGGGVYQRFVDFGFDFTALDRVFISHTHPDHVSDLPLFVQAIYLTGRQEPFEIYVPNEYVEPCRNLLGSMYLFAHRFPCPLKITGYHDSFIYHGDFELSAIANSHLAKFRVIDQAAYTNRGECYSFVMVVNGRRVLYSSDIGALDDIMPHWGECAYVLVEAAHIEWSRFWEEGAKARVGQFVITHLLSEPQAWEIQQQAHDRGVMNLQIAFDGMAISL
jgi:hypothetical protein